MAAFVLMAPGLSAPSWPLAGVGTAQGATYYVAPGGSDSDPGTEESAPWATIQHAADTLVAGDTVYIKAGTYPERVVPAHSGIAGHEIVYAACPGATVTIDGAGIALPDWLAGLFDVSGRSHIRIRGLRVIHAGTNDNSVGILMDGASHITVENCHTCYTWSSGIAAFGGGSAVGSSNITIVGNTVELACTNSRWRAYQEGISVAGTDTFEVRDNRVLGCGKEGICVKDGSRHGRVVGNLVADARRAGIYVDAWDKHTFDVEIAGNTLRGSRETDGIQLACEMGGLLENVRIHDNVAYSNAFCGCSLTTNGDDPSVTEHPMNGICVLNNTFYGNGWPWGGGIAVDNPLASNVVVRNNICSQNNGFQLIVATSVPLENVVVDHNLIDGYQGSEGEIDGSAPNLEGDPVFVDPLRADFHLRATSPCIDAGANEPSLPGAVDLDGQPRVFHGRVDVGADEAAIRSVGIFLAQQGIRSDWEVVPGGRCELQRCTDLRDPVWSRVGSVVTCEQRRLTFTDSSVAGAGAFYCVKWTMP